MPYIQVEAGALTPQQKEELIEKLTAVSSEVMGIPKEFFFTVIHELPEQNIGIGGKTIDKVKEEYLKQ